MIAIKHNLNPVVSNSAFIVWDQHICRPVCTFEKACKKEFLSFSSQIIYMLHLFHYNMTIFVNFFFIFMESKA